MGLFVSKPAVPEAMPECIVTKKNKKEKKEEPVPAPIPAPKERSFFDFFSKKEEAAPVQPGPNGEPKVEDVIEKLKEANEMLEALTAAKAAKEQKGGAKSKSKAKASKKKTTQKTKGMKQEGGFFLDADKAVLNTPGLIQSSNDPTVLANLNITDLKTMPGQPFSGGVSTNMLTSVQAYDTLFPYATFGGDATTSKKKDKGKKPTPAST